MKQILVPGSMLAVVASMLLPLPPLVLDFLVVVNLLLGFALLLSTLYVSDPLKLSSLPTLLLFATLFRLALTISTTRAILGSGDAGEVIKAFGEVVIQGNVVVGLVVFFIITIVQFVVIAKGAERVAEVAARFTLDALPGKQMSIDADVRAGLIDFESARQKRQDLQIESRFYGALDGAMKFIKGDSIAGLVSVAVNLCGGFILGIGFQGLSLAASASHFSILTIGDGLAAQIPALLNALAAGMVVTRVARGDGCSIASELPMQLGQLRIVKILAAFLAIVLGLLPGMPILPFLIIAVALVILALIHKNAPAQPEEKKSSWTPRCPALIAAVLSQECCAKLRTCGKEVEQALLNMRQEFHEEHGLLLPEIEVREAPPNQKDSGVWLRGVQVSSFVISSNVEEALHSLVIPLKAALANRLPELIDDRLTRRMLDVLEREYPELVSTVVPNLVSVTQVTSLVRGLAREAVSVRNFDLVIQTLAEHGAKVTGDRQLLEEARIALRRGICARIARADNSIEGYAASPIVDVAFLQAEKQGQTLSPAILDVIDKFFTTHESKNLILVTSKGARALMRDCLEVRDITIPVLAFEEIPADIRFNCLGTLGADISEDLHHEILLPLAA